MIRPMGAKPKRFGVGLSLAEANMVDDALRLLEETAPDSAETAMEQRQRLHRSIETQRSKAQQAKKKKPKIPPLPSTDALRRRVPGSFESGKRSVAACSFKHPKESLSKVFPPELLWIGPSLWKRLLPPDVSYQDFKAIYWKATAKFRSLAV